MNFFFRFQFVFFDHHHGSLKNYHHHHHHYGFFCWRKKTVIVHIVVDELFFCSLIQKMVDGFSLKSSYYVTKLSFFHSLLLILDNWLLRLPVSFISFFFILLLIFFCCQWRWWWWSLNFLWRFNVFFVSKMNERRRRKNTRPMMML